MLHPGDQPGGKEGKWRGMCISESERVKAQSYEKRMTEKARRKKKKKNNKLKP